ncbi:MAG: nucleotidyltransferase family protein [Phycisphaerales bacterium]|nr:MAG: nucleotidyltransferase family protein [Phycisphaerales bacterium]
MTRPASNPQVWGIIPAAGLSRRMGRTKQSLEFRGKTFTAAVTRTLLDAGTAGVVVVTRTLLKDELQLPCDPRVQIVFNDDATSEMIDSIRIGITALGCFEPHDRDGVLVVPADMPALRVESCVACIDSYLANAQPIVVATHKGKRGHPIIFPLALRRELDRLSDGLRMLPNIHKDQLVLVEVEDPGAELDIDTTEDLGKL